VKQSYVLRNESIVNLVFISSYFLRSVRVDGASEFGSGQDKRCSGLAVLGTKVKRETANRPSWWLCFWSWKYLAVPIISPEFWGWFVSVALLERGQCWGRRRRCSIQGTQNEYFKLQNYIYPKNKIKINNCDLLKAHNFCNGVQLWLLAAGTKQHRYTTSWYHCATQY
jgi:hypothetical protein